MIMLMMIMLRKRMGLAIKIISIPTSHETFIIPIFFVSSFPYLFHHSHNFKSFIIPIFSRLLFHHLIMNFAVSSHAPDIRSSWFKTHNVIKCPFYRMFLSDVRFIWICRQWLFSCPVLRAQISDSFGSKHTMVSNVRFIKCFYQMSVFFWICRQWLFSCPV